MLLTLKAVSIKIDFYRWTVLDPSPVVVFLALLEESFFEAIDDCDKDKLN